MSALQRPYQALDIDERVKRVLLETTLIDGHNDLPQQPRACFHGKIHNNPKFNLEEGFVRGMKDIPRLKQGMYVPLTRMPTSRAQSARIRGWAIWSVCVPRLRSA